MPNEFDDNQYYQYGPYPHMHPPYHHHPPFNHFCPDPRNLVVPIISTIGAGPKGDRGEAGVLKFGRDGEDSVLWDNTYAYDVGTFVIHDGISYVSIKDVPAGVEITDENYWMRVGNENVPYEQLTRDLNLERQARIAGDDDLNERLLQEVADRTAEDNDLAGDLAAEVAARIAGDQQNADDLDTEEAARIAGDLANQERFGDYYTKTEIDDLINNSIISADDTVVCIGDDHLAGYVDSSTTIAAWDSYMAEALGVTTENIFKAYNVGAGFSAGAKLNNLVTQVRDSVVNAGKTADGVKVVIIEAGLNDLRDFSINHYNIGGDASALISLVTQTFPNAMVHVFPFVIGNFGASSRLGLMEEAILNSFAQVNIKKVAFHKNCWTWNYEGNDSGIHSDGKHLLAAGQRRVGISIANEINGGDSSRMYAKFAVKSAADGTTVMSYARRVGSEVHMGFSQMLRTIGPNHSCFTHDGRYGNSEFNGTGYNPGFMTLFRAGDNKIIQLWYDRDNITWQSYNEFTADYATQGYVTWPIETRIE